MSAQLILQDLSGYLMLLPLIFFCFIPVQGRIKSHPLRLCGKIALVLFVFVTVLVAYMLFTKQGSGNLLFFASIPFFFFFYRREVDLDSWTAWFVLCTACALGGISFLIATISDILLHPTGNYMNFSVEALLIQVGFLLFVDTICYPIIHKYLGWIILHYKNESIWKIIWVFPISFSIASQIIIPHDYRLAYVGRSMLIYFTMHGFIILFIILLYCLFYNVAYSTTQARYAAEQVRILETQAEEYTQLQEHIRETRYLRHDFRQQLIAISGLVHQKQYDELETYLEKYQASMTEQYETYCSQASINAILSHYVQLCKASNIPLQFHVQIPEGSRISDIDYCIVFGNLMENAIYGCRETKGTPFLHLKAAPTAQHAFVLNIANSYSGQLNMKNNELLSSRHPGTGVGLKSVEAVCDKYHGKIYLTHDDNHFQVKVYLPC